MGLLWTPHLDYRDSMVLKERKKSWQIQEIQTAADNLTTIIVGHYIFKLRHFTDIQLQSLHSSLTHIYLILFQIINKIIKMTFPKLRITTSPMFLTEKLLYIMRTLELSNMDTIKYLDIDIAGITFGAFTKYLHNEITNLDMWKRVKANNRTA